jgi:hypothetical protein
MERLREVADLIIQGHAKAVTFDRKSAGAELRHLLETPGYTTDKSQLKERGLEEFKMKDEKPADDALSALVQPELDAITELLANSGETFMLASPETLTVKKANGGYSKKAHIGSEDFKPLGAYMGKRGKLIFVFKPVMVADYVEMEMDEHQAKEKLMGFKDWCRENIAEVHAKIAETRAEQAVEKEKEAMAKRSDQYAHLGFGEW